MVPPIVGFYTMAIYTVIWTVPHNVVSSSQAEQHRQRQRRRPFSADSPEAIRPLHAAPASSTNHYPAVPYTHT
jgi:hypothetical protein